jgi:hypothetical protein
MEEQGRALSREDWPAGPWDAEPEDRHEWRDEATGLPCLMVRNPAGAWCGYVGVPPAHPFYGVEYSGCPYKPACGDSYCEHSPDHQVTVHGGLTYSNRCQGHICHVAQPGEPEPWWLGFDCVHSGDLAPGMARFHSPALLKLETYKDAAYVRTEVASLAAQLAELSKANA